MADTTRSRGGKITEEYVVVFVNDSNGSVVGYLGRDKLLTPQRERAFEFDENYPNTEALIARASTQLGQCVHGTKIEIRELWEL